MRLSRWYRWLTRSRVVLLLASVLILCLFGTLRYHVKVDVRGEISGSNITVAQRREAGRMAPYNRNIIENRKNDNTIWFKDSLIWGKRRQKSVYLTIGIPCILRPNQDKYIIQTLNSLIKHSSPAHKEDMLIVLFLADIEESARKEIGEFLHNKYREYVDSGFIQMIKAPGTFYPEFRNLTITYKDPLSKVKWRSKQNFDFAFNMLYSQSLSEFYLQLEDDVITVANYFQIIKDFIAESDRKGKNWVCLEFCSLGFIAKLYHSKHLEKLAQMLMLFYNEHPNDVTYLRFNELMFQTKRIIRKPTIFDHKGKYSSMMLKINTLKDNMFKGDPNDVDNDPDNKTPKRLSKYPPAKLSTTFKQYESYTPEKFYTGEETIYWCYAPKEGDSFTIVFNQAQRVSNISLETGHSYYPEDILRNGVLQLGTSCSSFVRSGEFKNGHVTISDIPRDPAIACIKIQVQKRQPNWLIISKLSIGFHRS